MVDPSGLFLPILHLLMVLPRVGSVWMFFPVLGQGNLPMNVRLMSSLALALAMVPLASPHLPPWTLSHLPQLPELVFFVARELTLGLGMGLVARWLFTAATASAHWVGTQMGFTVGNLFNPDLQTTDSAWSELHHWLAVMIFFAIGGHWLLLQAVADSYHVNVIDIFSHLADAQASMALWAEVGTRFFTWMLKLAGPLVVVLLLLQTAMGVLSRFIPQVNLWMVSLPVTLGVGVLVFTLLSPLYSDALRGLFGSLHETNYLWLRYLGAR